MGHLRGGQRLLRVVRPKISGDRSEDPREGADVLTPRAEEFDMQNADWLPLWQAIYKGIEGSEWEEPYHHYRDLSKAACW